MSAAPRTSASAPAWHPALPDAEECRRRFDRLYPRQRQIIGMLAGGWTSKQVARELGIALKTVQVHVDRAATALDVRPPQPAVTALYHRAMTATAPVVAIVQRDEPAAPSASELLAQLRQLRAS